MNWPSAETWIDLMAPVPQAWVVLVWQSLPPWPTRPGPVETGPLKLVSSTPLAALRMASLERCHTHRLPFSDEPGVVPQLALLSGRPFWVLLIWMVSKSPPTKRLLSRNRIERTAPWG